MRILTVTLLVLLISSSAVAQPRIDLISYFDRQNNTTEFFRDIYWMSNGDFALCGKSGMPWILRLSANGEDVRWQYTHLGERYFSIIEADNGDIVSGGILENGAFGVTRLNGEGRLVWDRAYVRGRATAIIELKEGDFLICGNTNAIGGDNSGLVYRLTGDGRTVWNRTYNSCRGFTGMKETENGVVLAGYRVNGNTFRGWIQRITLDGEVVWQREYLPDGATSAHYEDLISTNRGFAAGGAYSPAEGNRSGFMMTFIDADGNVLEHKLYDMGAGGHWLYSLTKVGTQGFALAGDGPGGGGNGYPYILRLNRSGDVIWTKDFSDLVDEQPALHDPNYAYNWMTSVISLPNSVIVAAGVMYNTDGGDRRNDGVVVRFAPEPLGPQILYWSPEDTLLDILQGEAVQFIVRARTREGMELAYNWAIGDSVIGEETDTSRTIWFDSLRTYDVSCRVQDPDWALMFNWHVTTHDLFIRTHSPDTLSLTIHHGETVPFAMSVAATPGDDPTYLWTLTDWAGGRFDTLGTDSVVSHLFDHGGNYLMEGMASRGASADTVAWNIRVLSNMVAYHPDRTRLTFMQDTTVVFSVEPSEFDTGQYRYEWSVDGGWCSDSASALVGFPFLGQSVVKAVVVDSAEADTIVWEVEVVEPNATPPTPPSIEGGDYPNKFTLTVSPNPFNHRTAIRYAIPERSEVRVSAYDVSGRLVKELYRGDRYPGDYSILWQAPAAGVYLIQVETEGGYRRVAKGVCLP